MTRAAPGPWIWSYRMQVSTVGQLSVAPNVMAIPVMVRHDLDGEGMHGPAMPVTVFVNTVETSMMTRGMNQEKFTRMSTMRNFGAYWERNSLFAFMIVRMAPMRRRIARRTLTMSRDTTHRLSRMAFCVSGRKKRCHAIVPSDGERVCWTRGMAMYTRRTEVMRTMAW